METKICCRCNEEKSIGEFNKNAGNKSGYKYSCKKCDKEAREKRKNENIRNYFVDVIRTSKQMSKKRLILEYNIDTEYLVELYREQEGRCSISGIKMTHISGKGKVATNVSIDRIDNLKGYTKGNIQLVCISINMMKLNMDNEEFLDFLNQLAISICKSKNLDCK